MSGPAAFFIVKSQHQRRTARTISSTLTDAETQPLEYVIVPKGDQAVPTQESSIQEYRAAIETLFEHSMTEEEAACFRPEMASSSCLSGSAKPGPFHHV